VITTVGQHGSTLSCIYLIIRKRVHVAKYTNKNLKLWASQLSYSTETNSDHRGRSKFGNLTRRLLLLPKTCPAFSLLGAVPDVMVVFAVQSTFRITSGGDSST